MQEQLVSIVISAFNAEKYIAETLESVLLQTWRELEVIVVNDGSTDRTAGIVSSYADRGIILITQENRGQDAALNNGYRHSKGSYIKFMDSDDLINPEMIQKQMEMLNGSDDMIAYSEWSRFYKDDPGTANFEYLDYWKDAPPVDFLTSRKESVMLQCGIMLVPRALIEKAGLWNERLILFNDTEFYMRLILESKGLKFTPGARLYYRSGMSKSISAQRSRKFFESTFLATCLAGERLMRYEDSPRTRTLISNLFLDQYFLMYPSFPDLMKKHEDMIAKYGHANIELKGGRVFMLLKKLFGGTSPLEITIIEFCFESLRYLLALDRMFVEINKG